ncbi:hypothetical protein BC567DRAFT_225989 [Phyllosticta citribraziliensis]
MELQPRALRPLVLVPHHQALPFVLLFQAHQLNLISHQRVIATSCELPFNFLREPHRLLALALVLQVLQPLHQHTLRDRVFRHRQHHQQQQMIIRIRPSLFATRCTRHSKLLLMPPLCHFPNRLHPFQGRRLLRWSCRRGLERSRRRSVLLDRLAELLPLLEFAEVEGQALQRLNERGWVDLGCAHFVRRRVLGLI